MKDTAVASSTVAAAVDMVVTSMATKEVDTVVNLAVAVTTEVTMEVPAVPAVLHLVLLAVSRARATTVEEIRTVKARAHTDRARDRMAGAVKKNMVANRVEVSVERVVTTNSRAVTAVNSKAVTVVSSKVIRDTTPN